MGYKVVYNIEGDALKDKVEVFDPTLEKGASVIDVFENYVAQGWISSYTRKDITDTKVEDTLIFISKEKRDAFRSDIEAITTDHSEMTTLTLSIISEGEE